MIDLSDKRICIARFNEIALVSSFRQYIATDVVNRPDWVLIYKVSGHVKYHVNGKILDFSPGMICYMPKGASYKIERIEKGEAIRIAFEAVEDPKLPMFTEHFRNSGAFKMQFYKILSLFRTSVLAFDYRVMAAVYELLALLDKSVRMSYVGVQNSERIQAVTDFLGSNFSDSQLSLSTLAQTVGMAPSTLRSNFSKVYGMPPMHYLKLLRLNTAKSMLTATDMTMEEIAEASGFCDQFYFSKFFKANCGVSPSDYRRLHLM